MADAVDEQNRLDILSALTSCKKEKFFGCLLFCVNELELDYYYFVVNNINYERIQPIVFFEINNLCVSCYGNIYKNQQNLTEGTNFYDGDVDSFSFKSILQHSKDCFDS